MSAMLSKALIQFFTIYMLVMLSAVVGEDTHSMRFGVGLTTIPPRYPTVHHVVASWLAQQTPPEVIVIFVPYRYQNFMSESPRDRMKNIVSLRDELAKHHPEDVSNGRIVVQAVDKDWGPITKYLGLLEHFEVHSSQWNVNFWVIGDDDVRYSENTLSAYAAAIEKEKSHMSISTHFKVHPRVQVNMGDHVVSVNHLQGVDTILIPTALLRRDHESGRGINYIIFAEGAKLFHEKCPDSFFQDDYLVSFLVAMSGVDVRSIWNGQKVAHHVNSVSKSNQQMHVHPQVFQREDNTKHCISQHGGVIKRLLEKKAAEHSHEL